MMPAEMAPKLQFSPDPPDPKEQTKELPDLVGTKQLSFDDAIGTLYGFLTKCEQSDARDRLLTRLRSVDHEIKAFLDADKSHRRNDLTERRERVYAACREADIRHQKLTEECGRLESLAHSVDELIFKWRQKVFDTQGARCGASRFPTRDEITAHREVVDQCRAELRIHENRQAEYLELLAYNTAELTKVDSQLKRLQAELQDIDIQLGGGVRVNPVGFLESVRPV